MMVHTRRQSINLSKGQALCERMLLLSWECEKLLGILLGGKETALFAALSSQDDDHYVNQSSSNAYFKYHYISQEKR